MNCVLVWFELFLVFQGILLYRACKGLVVLLYYGRMCLLLVLLEADERLLRRLRLLRLKVMFRDLRVRSLMVMLLWME